MCKSIASDERSSKSKSKHVLSGIHVVTGLRSRHLVFLYNYSHIFRSFVCQLLSDNNAIRQTLAGHQLLSETPETARHVVLLSASQMLSDI
jgi:hypothetical protein